MSPEGQSPSCSLGESEAVAGPARPLAGVLQNRPTSGRPAPDAQLGVRRGPHGLGSDGLTGVRGIPGKGRGPRRGVW